MTVGEDVYCTLVLSDSYLPGAAVLAKSLRDSGTTKALACMVDQDNLRYSTLAELQSLYDYTIPVSRIGNPVPKNLYLMRRPDLLFTFTKIHLWRLTQFRKIVYIDSDVVALRAPDELFDTSEDFAAAPDVGWPDAFNTGVMVLAPNMGDYWALQTLARAGDSFDGADQGLLNQYFEHKPWKRLSFTYNCTPSANYQYEPAYRYYKSNISLVHFIGSGKPWQTGRGAEGASGAYQELLSRWWAVYDRHFKTSTSDYISSGRREPVSRAIQEEVRGEPSNAGSTGYYATGYPADMSRPAPSTMTEVPFTEPGETAENIDQGRIDPTPTAEARKFSAPFMEWDATRDAPPPQSKPEAPNFPTETYEFTTNPEQFRPPASYPQTPRDTGGMGYEAPKPKPGEEKLAPIFPWEERETPKPTRRFVEDVPLPPPPVPAREPEFHGADEFEVSMRGRPPISPATPTFSPHERARWDHFSATTKNAWDEVGGIEAYVRALAEYQKNRDKVHAQQMHILEPANEPTPEELIEKVQKRRESLILTDFPTAVERPSLPVTPAPIRRATFWGGERDENNDLPAAEGVPNQSDWDPSAQLEQLRRNSLLTPSDLNIKMPNRKPLPNREMPETAAPVSPEATSHPQLPIGGGGSAPGVGQAAPVFSEPDFGGASPASGMEQQGPLSPAEGAVQG